MSNLRRHLEVALAAVLYYSGLVGFSRFLNNERQKCLVIFCYHRASGGDLQAHVSYLRRHYRICHLDQALEELYTPEMPPNGIPRDPRPNLVLTFDDGYADNYTHAADLATTMQAPMTIFLVPGHVESGKRFWWDEATYIPEHATVNQAYIGGQLYQVHDARDRAQLAKFIEHTSRYAPSVADREVFLAEARAALEVTQESEAEERSDLLLTWDEVYTMEDSTWVSFGAHTMNYPVLANLHDPREVFYEIDESRAVLIEHLSRPVRTFAYPVGGKRNIGKPALQAVRAAGFTWAVTCLPGFNTPRTKPYMLHRFVVDVDQHWLLVAAKASGIWSFFVSPWHFLIALARIIQAISVFLAGFSCVTGTCLCQVCASVYKWIEAGTIESGI